MPATIVVRLPADAVLTIDDRPTRSTSAVRRFDTPPLPPQGQYSYTLKASAVRDGRPVTATKQVMVSAGQQTEVSLPLPPGGEPPR
jgi:uncharacterized protein (TIGR03000 family)